MLPASPTATTPPFQLALPLLLASVSPSLAALHATRARLLYPADTSLAETHCAKCGYPYSAGDSRTRSLRKRRRTNSGPRDVIRVLRRSCRICGHDEDVPLAAASDVPAHSFPKPRDRPRGKSGIALPRASGAATPAPVEPTSLLPAPLPPRSLPPPIASPSTPVPSRPGSAASARPTPHLGSAKVSSASSSKESTPAAQEPARAKSRPKKKTGLQNLLARNREREEQEKKKREGSQSQGLSSFLQGL